MRIGIGFFGIPRDSAAAFPSIEENILRPAARLGEVTVRYHLYRQERVFNPRSREDAPLDPAQYRPFEAFPGETEKPEGVAEGEGLEALRARGDAWSDGAHSLRNLLLQLHSLSRVTAQLEAAGAEVVVFARPDLRYHHSFEPGLRATLGGSQRRVARLPFWQWAGGYNDRFAVCGREAFPAYGRRLEQAGPYLERHPGRPLHAERLLRFALDRALVAVRPLDVRASRVRVGGEEVREDFSRVQAGRIVRWWFREGGKAVARCWGSGRRNDG